MKDVVTIIAFATLIAAILMLDQAVNGDFPLLVASLLLLQSFVMGFYGFMMSVGYKDVRISAILMIIVGEYITWLYRSPVTDMDEVCWGFGVLLAITGLIWAAVEYVNTPICSTWPKSLK